MLVPTKEDFQNEFSIITRKRSFTISARYGLLTFMIVLKEYFQTVVSVGEIHQVCCWLVSAYYCHSLNILVMSCWCGYPSGARSRLFAYGLPDATAVPVMSCLI